jgi:pSer/pThr/pTyr-binding forkhead associated (FHA) protein
MALRLRYRDKTTVLATGQLVIGRSMECNVVVNDPLASRRHAMITMSQSGAFVSDLGSKAGVQVNGATISGARKLAAGDVIQISTALITVEDVHGPEEPAEARQRTTQVPPPHPPVAAGFRLAPTPPLGIARVVSSRHGETIDAADDDDDASELLTRTQEAPRVPLPPEAPPVKRSPAPTPSSPRPESLKALATVAEKALALNRAEEAERIVQRALLDTLEAARRGDLAGAGLEIAGLLGARLAFALGSGRWFDYTVTLYATCADLMPASVVDLLFSAVHRAKPIDKLLFRKYLAGARASAGDSPARRFVIQRLEGVQRVLDLK